MLRRLVPTCMAASLSALCAGPAWPAPAGVAPAASLGGLPRGADWGAWLVYDEPSGGARVRSVAPRSAAERAGLRAGDVVRRVNRWELRDRAELRAMMRALRGGDDVHVTIARDGRTLDLRFVLPSLPLERIPGVETRYDAVTSELGHHIRVIVTRPAGTRGRIPAVVFVPWLSCDAVEYPFGPGDGWSHLLWGLAARSGFGLVRVEKPGVGDSGGPDCSQNDLRADLAAFRAALGAVRSDAWIDTTRVFLFGGSIGGGLAPILAAELPVKGIVVAGAFTKTWFEHMLEIERRRLSLEGTAPAEINQAMRGYAELYHDYLYGGLTPGRVLELHPGLTRLWTDAPDGQYGRPAAYFQQVAQLDVEGAWEKISAPVLVLHGEYDWIMGRDDQERIVQIVNARHPGHGTLVELLRTDHNLDVYPSAEDAFRGRGARFDDALVDRVCGWLRAHRD